MSLWGATSLHDKGKDRPASVLLLSSGCSLQALVLPSAIWVHILWRNMGSTAQSRRSTGMCHHAFLGQVLCGSLNPQSTKDSLWARITAWSLVCMNERQGAQRRMLARDIQSCYSEAQLECFHLLVSYFFPFNLLNKMRTQANVNMSRLNYRLCRKKYMLLGNNLDYIFKNRYRNKFNPFHHRKASASQ